MKYETLSVPFNLATMLENSSIVYDFQKQLEFGKRGEEVVFGFLKDKPETVQVIDLSEKGKFQSLGIDGQWIYKNENSGIIHSTFFDVKTDFQVHKTGKLFIETNSSDSKSGCMLTTCSEYFLYYDPVSGKLYTVQIYPLRNWYKRKGIAKKHFTVTNKTYESEGILLTIEELEEISALESIENIKTINLN